MTADPAFWGLAAGFALILLGVSPLLPSRRAVDVPELGCAMIFVGIVIVCVVTATKVLP